MEKILSSVKDVEIAKSRIPKNIQHLSFCKVGKDGAINKEPFESKYDEKPYTLEQISSWVARGYNYGILSGYHDLATFDCDCRPYVELAEKHLPATFSVMSSCPEKGHLYYYIKDFPSHLNKILLIDPDAPDDPKKQGGDIRYQGFQTVGPGSIHPSGVMYTVHDDLPIAALSFAVIQDVFGKFFKTSVIPPSVRKNIDDSSASLSIASVIEHYKIELTPCQYGDEKFGPHPVHGSTGGTNFRVNTKDNVWCCFRCNSGGGSMSLIAVMEGIIDCVEARAGGLKGDKFIETCRIVKEKLGFDVNVKLRSQTKTLLSEDKITDLKTRIEVIPKDTDQVKIPALIDPILKEIANVNIAQSDALLKDTIKKHFGFKGVDLKSYERVLNEYRNESAGCQNLPQGEVLTRICEENIKTYFTNQQGEPFVILPVDGHLETCSARSTRLRNWMAGIYREKNHHPPNRDALKQAQIQVEVICSKSQQLELFNRIGWHEGAIYYDLTTPDWKGVKITKDGWDITALPPMFRRYKHQVAQVIPTADGSPGNLLRFCNIRENDHCLFMVTIATFFIPNIPHVIPYLDGTQGGGKTMTSKSAKGLVDPSAVMLMSTPKDLEHVQMIGDKHWVTTFDNISYIKEWFSDFLCRAATGEGDMKRSLYTDDEEFIRAYRRCFVLNGIGTYAERPDLLDRLIIFDIPELHIIRPEDEIKAEWKLMLPGILGGFFTAISKAMGLVDQVKGHEMFRMSDYARWGAALAEPLGYSQDEFFKKYQKSIDRKWEDAADVNTLNGRIVELMHEREEWKGSFSKLLEEVNPRSDRDKNLPDTAKKLSSAIKRIRPLLHTSGLKVSYPTAREPGTGRRQIIIHRFNKQIMGVNVGVNICE